MSTPLRSTPPPPPPPPPPPQQQQHVNDIPAKAADQVNSLQHFQQHSRLHFIGQWRTKMNDEFQEWFREHPEWNHGRLTSQSLFIHVDLDAFFCSVQLAKKENAHLRSLPVCIAAGRFNSDISSCNYVARSFGISAGMYVNAARELCPNLVVLGYDLPACEQVSKTLYRILFECFAAAQPSVCISLEVYSIDEVMIAADTSDYGLLRGVCERARSELESTTGCTASCGIGPNIMLARLATQNAKPNGIRVTTRDCVPGIMQSLPLREIHGAGRSTRTKVQQLLLRTGIIGGASPSGRVVGERGGGSSDDTKAEGEDVVARPSSAEDSEEAGDDIEDGNSRPGLSAVVLCSHVQKLTRGELQAALGKRAGETLYHLCRGEDFRVTRRTGDPEEQRALGRALPSSVGCSMNYAVRPRCLEDVWSIARQLLDDVCAKLRRVDAVAQGLRVTLLERHPYHPKETQKFMGRGRCVEAHVPVRFAHPLDAEAASLMMEGLKLAIGPLLVTSRWQSDEERAAQLGLQGRALDSQIIWTVTLARLENVLVEDVRGMTVQATGLRPRAEARNSDTASAARAQARERGFGQMSLAAAFSHAKRRPPAVEEVGPIPPRPKAARRESVTPDVVALDEEDAVSSPAVSGQSEMLTLRELFGIPWGERYRGAWHRGCACACAERDIPLVRAYLRAALLALSSSDPPPPVVSDAGGTSGSKDGASAAEGELSKLVNFVEARLGGGSVDFL